ncbi:carboxypeptidase-like regulatory domain-containing protein [Ferrimicrobium sp.]|uniref:beta strand repeat-containing protein n=1 Tax=Ferrimicrobium sp. TaxID=2926050 RepID=UPI00260C19A3|nr:carboxypeptidase-like regulatory domain-containing protein [Ferrimicrobium sp.]
MSTSAPSLRLIIDDVVLAPGDETPIRVQIANLGTESLAITLELRGIDPEWYRLPMTSVTVAAKSTAEVEFFVTIPRSYPASALPAALIASSDTTPVARQRAGFTLTIGDARALSARLDPPEIDGRHVGVASVVIRNRGSQPERYSLSGKTTGQRLSISFDNPNPVVPPGQESAVKATIRTKPRLTGSVQRYPFAIMAQGRSHPVELTGAFSSHPALGTKTAKIAALLAVLLVWGALASIGIGAFDASLHRRAVAAQSIPSPTAQPVKNKIAKTSSSSTTTTKAAAPSQASTSTSSVSLVGTVHSSSPGGVRVSATPVAATVPATAANQSGSSTPPGGMVYANTTTASLNAAATNTLGPTVTTYTAPDGAFVLSGLKPGVSYLVTFSKPGFTTHKVLLSPAHIGQQIKISAKLVPGTGALSGTVYGPSGPMGDALVTVSNGLLNFATHTASVGSGVGTWSVSQISTPGSYLIQVSAPGYGTQVQTVTLGPSASQSNISTHLTANVGSITGVISSATTNAPLGGAEVTATNGQQSVKATTFTVGKVGAYDLPNLTIPGHWTVSISAPGYQTQTEAVNLTGNTTVNTVLTQAGGNLTGTINLPANAGKNTTNTIGLTLTEGSTVYKTLSTSRTAGSPTVAYQFPQVLPGVYTLTAEGFGFTTVSTTVTLTAGATTTTNLTLALTSSTALDNATITGTVTGVGGQTLPSVPIELDGNQVTTTNASGTYSIHNVAPGVATITAVGTAITTNNPNGYTTASQQVDVGSGATVTAPTIALNALASVTGQFLDSASNQPISQVQVPGCSATPVASISLTQGGKVVATQTATSADTYSFLKVTPGSYVLKASATCFEPTQVAIDITNGQNLTQQIDLATTPTYSILVEQLQTSSGATTTTPVPVVGACVTLSPKTAGVSGSSLATGTNGTADFANLSLGAVYSVTVDQYPGSASCPPAGSPAPTASQSTSFTAEPNGTTATVFLAPTFTSLTVGLSFPYVVDTSNLVTDCPIGSAGSSPCPTISSSASVSLTAIDGYQSSSVAGQVQTKTITATQISNSSSWTFPASSLTGVISGSAVLHVSAPGFETLSKTVALPTASSGSSITELLTPRPVPVSIDAPSSLSLAVTPSALVPASNNTLSGPTTIAINTSNGSYLWTDPATGSASGYAEPGIYQVSGSGAGRALAPETVIIPACSSATCASITLDLTQTSLTVSPTDLPGGASAASALLCSSSSNTTLASASFTGGSVEFFGLGAGSGYVTPTCTSYSYQITLDGVVTYQSALSTSTSFTSTPALTYVAGTLLGTPYPGGPSSPLSNITVYVCPQGTTPCDASSYLATGTTGPNGDFIAPSQLSSPLASSTSYSVGTSSTAYQQPSNISVSACTSTKSPCSPTNITLIANLIAQTISVSTGQSSTTVTVTPTTTSAGATEKGTTTITSTCSGSGSAKSCSATFSLTLAPAQWTFEISAPGYSDAFLGPITYEPGSEPSELTTSLLQDTSTVSGTVTVAANATSPSSTPIAGLSLTLASTSSTSFSTETTTTSKNGTYSFANPVPTGSYTITVASSSGYFEQSPVNFATQYPNPTVDNFTVYAPGESLQVTLSSPLGVSSSDLANATVTLTPVTTATPPITCQGGGDPLLGLPPTTSQSTPVATSTTSTQTTYAANFASLTPDVYSVDVTGSEVPAQPTPLPTISLCPSESSATAPITVEQGEVSGTITDSSLASGSSVTVTLTAKPSSGTGASTTTTSCTLNNSGSSSAQASCNYTLPDLQFNVTYTIIPTASGYTFTPKSASFTPSKTNGATDTSIDFTASG